jgi:hypothetical protein
MRSSVSSYNSTRTGLGRALPGGEHDSSPGAALVEIRDLASDGRIAYVPRAWDRLRGIQARDVRVALRTAEACHPRDHGRWRVEGLDLSGERLTVFIVVKDGVLVVTAA